MTALIYLVRNCFEEKNKYADRVKYSALCFEYATCGRKHIFPLYNDSLQTRILKEKKK